MGAASLSLSPGRVEQGPCKGPSGLLPSWSHWFIVDERSVIVPDKSVCPTFFSSFGFHLVSLMDLPPSSVRIPTYGFVCRRVVLGMNPGVRHTTWGRRTLKSKRHPSFPHTFGVLLTSRTGMVQVVPHLEYASKSRTAPTALELIRRHYLTLSKSLFRPPNTGKVANEMFARPAVSVCTTLLTVNGRGR